MDSHSAGNVIAIDTIVSLKGKYRELNSTGVVPISTAPAVEPAMIDLNALG